MAVRKSKNRFEFRRTVAAQPVRPEGVRQIESVLAKLVAQAYLADYLELQDPAYENGEDAADQSP